MTNCFFNFVFEDNRRLLLGRLFVGLVVLFGMATNQCLGDSTIDTLSGWNGTDETIYIGEPDTATYGQTITVGSDSFLNDFTFLLRQDTAFPLTFQAFVMEWDDAASRATGPVLFESGVVSTSLTGAFETFTFDTGSLSLTSGEDYVLFLNTSDHFDGNFDETAQASRNDIDAYDEGLFVFLNNGDDFSRVTLDAWDRDFQGVGFDTAFTANFSAVPEPSAFGLGLMAMLGFNHKRRR